MHRTLLAIAGAAMLLCGGLTPKPAIAMTLPAPAALAGAAAGVNNFEQAAIVCGPYRCFRRPYWRRYYWRPRYRPYVYRPFFYRPFVRPLYRPYFYRPYFRPYYRPYWRRRYWW